MISCDMYVIPIKKTCATLTTSLSLSVKYSKNTGYHLVGTQTMSYVVRCPTPLQPDNSNSKHDLAAANTLLSRAATGEILLRKTFCC